MKLFGLAGWSGAGKTTLIETLLSEMVARGLRVSTVKHAHHGFDIDHPGKDSYRHRVAGATEVLVVSDERWALLHERRGGPEPTLEALVARLGAVDLVLVEGFKKAPHAKIEVFRPALGKPPLWPDDSSIAAVASDVPAIDCGDRPLFELTDSGGITDFILSATGLG
jgi:molybdopterin-guanine dinucleotide biosynthesis protein B